MSNDVNTLATALDMTVVEPERPTLPVAQSGGDEYTNAKANMEAVVQVGNQALAELADMAFRSQDPRVYRVLTELIQAMVTANKETMEIKKTQVELEGDNQPQKVQNNMFVGSTAELAEMLKQLKS